MSNLIRELYFADAFYYKDFENSSEMNKELTDKKKSTVKSSKNCSNI